MILQIGAFFGNLIKGIGTGVTSIITQAAQVAAPIGQQFLARELSRKLQTTERRRVQAQAVQVLNTPGISVARVGGTTQPVGGRVQRSTFTSAAFTPAQSPIGNIPLLPVGTRTAGFFPKLPFGIGFPQPSSFPIGPTNGRNGNVARVMGAEIGPKFAKDEMGNTIMFVPSPRGEGFISVQQARSLNLSAMKPWWRFNRQEGQFEKIKPRRMNPFNFKAAARAGRRIDRTLDAVKTLVVIQKKKDKGVSAGGSIVRFKTKKKK